MPMDTTDEMYQKDSTPEKPDMEDSDDESMEDSALVPKSLFGSKTPKPGDTCKFKVVHIHDDEVEIEYVKRHKDKEDKPESEDEDLGDPFSKMEE